MIWHHGNRTKLILERLSRSFSTTQLCCAVSYHNIERRGGGGCDYMIAIIIYISVYESLSLKNQAPLIKISNKLWDIHINLYRPTHIFFFTGFSCTVQLMCHRGWCKLISTIECVGVRATALVCTICSLQNIQFNIFNSNCHTDVHINIKYNVVTL